MNWYPKSEEDLAENEKWYHIFRQSIKYQYPQRVLLDKKFLRKISEEKPILAYTSSVGEIWMICESFYGSWDDWAFQWLFPKFSDYNRKHIQFILACLNKIFVQFDYWTWVSNVMSLEFLLPCSKWQIDFDFMETFIRAIEKQIIKDTALWSEKKMRAYRQVVK